MLNNDNGLLLIELTYRFKNMLN